MSRQWPDMFFGKMVGGATMNRPVPAKPVSAASVATPIPSRTAPILLPSVPPFMTEPQLETTRIPLPLPLVKEPPSVSAARSGQWPEIFFGRPQPLPPSHPKLPTSVTARVPLSSLPPGAQPPYLEPPRLSNRTQQWPTVFFGEPESKPVPPPVSSAHSPVPAEIVPEHLVPAPGPTVSESPRVSPAVPAYPAAPDVVSNPLAPFLTPIGQRPTGISKITFPTASPVMNPAVERVNPPQAPPSPPATAPRPPQPDGIPTPMIPPAASISIAQSIDPSTVVFPPAFGQSEPQPDVPPTRSAQDVAQSAPEVEREFLLNNGERVSGRVVSESPEAVYLHSNLLGVLTLPRKQLATRLREVILLNGDRIIGDVIAETDDMIYIRNASLGTLTIPKSHSAQKVIEIILKNGDRVVGELISENEELVLIKSATLGTISVNRQSLEMINRRLEHHPIKPLSS